MEIKQKIIDKIKNKNGFIMDMDGVLYHGDQLLPGVKRWVQWLKDNNKRYLFLTNASEHTPKELSEKLGRMGIHISEYHFYTSALSTAIFLSHQKPNGDAYIIGESGLINALYNVGYTMNSHNPDYVVVGDAFSYSFEKISRAIDLVKKGAKLIGTNPDISTPIENGMEVPSTKALIAPIEIVTGKKAYFLGKPNPLMMVNALKMLQCNKEESIIIGDRMDTDIIAGMEAELDTCLVLSGITREEDVQQFPYKPNYILNGIIDLIK